MARILPLLTALVVVLAGGLVHGLWTERWQSSPLLEAAVLRLDRFPDQVGLWQGGPEEADPKAFQQAGAAGYQVRRFRHPRHGQISVILMCGRPGPMSVHRPEHCYEGAGYEMTTPPSRSQVRCRPSAAEAEFWSAVFGRQEETRAVRLRIFWSWYDGQAWRAPRSPRFTFAPLPALYKLYVIREVTDAPPRAEEELARDFLRQLIPKLSKALSPP